MNAKIKKWLVLAGVMLIIGGTIFVVSMSYLKWDFNKLSLAKYENNSYSVTESFSSLAIDTDTADVTFAISTDNSVRVDLYEESNAKHEVLVEDGTLKITVKNNKAWYEYIGFNFSSPKITVYLPLGAYGNLDIDLSTGDIVIPNGYFFNNVQINGSTADVIFNASASGSVNIDLSTGDIVIKNASAPSFSLMVTTGDIELIDVNLGTLVSSGSTGDVDLIRVIAIGKIDITRTTGDVEFESIDASELYIKTTTGDVEGSLLSSKIFIVETNTGDKRVPQTTTGGKCEIKTGTGDVEITVVQ